MYIRYGRLLLLTTVVVLFARAGSIENLVTAMALLSVLLVPVHMFILTRVLPVTMRTLLATLFRPLTAACAMYFALAATPILTNYLAVELLGRIFAGTLIYVAALLALWWMSGLPKGPESMMTAKISEWRKKRSAR